MVEAIPAKDTITADEEDDEVEAGKCSVFSHPSWSKDADVHDLVPILTCQDLLILIGINIINIINIIPRSLFRLVKQIIWSTLICM